MNKPYKIWKDVNSNFIICEGLNDNLPYFIYIDKYRKRSHFIVLYNYICFYSGLHYDGDVRYIVMNILDCLRNNLVGKLVPADGIDTALELIDTISLISRQIDIIKENNNGR